MVGDILMTEYLMENREEIKRLEIKTDAADVERQAIWAGIRPGMRVADIGCGSGKTTAILHGLVSPDGKADGIDISEARIDYAKNHYQRDGIDFIKLDIKKSMDTLPRYDFVWVRFFLEYFRSDCFEIVSKISDIVKPGGILCLIDLDSNSLNHYPLSDRLSRTLQDIAAQVSDKMNFDFYAGSKLYSHLYRLGYCDIEVDVRSHHLIYGNLKDRDSFNWMKKMEVITKKLGYDFKEFPGGYDECVREFNRFFKDPGRFTYTPIIACKGRRPLF